jgi:hypothetical protein
VIELMPVADGLFTSSFDITSDDLDTPTVTVNLEGRSGPGDLSGTWAPLTQTCTATTRGTRCKLRGTLVVENTGYKDVPSSSVYFYLSEDGRVDPPIDTYVKKSSTGKVKFEDNKNITFSYRFPYGVSVSGKYIIAVLDLKNKVLEVDEDNNIVMSGEIPLPIP